MKKILLAAVLILIAAVVIYAAANSYPRVKDNCTREWEYVK
jgi:hypothetical protein